MSSRLCQMLLLAGVACFGFGGTVVLTQPKVEAGQPAKEGVKRQYGITELRKQFVRAREIDVLHADASRIVKSVIQAAQAAELDLTDLLPEGRFAALAFKLVGCERTIEVELKRAEEGLPEADAAQLKAAVATLDDLEPKCAKYRSDAIRGQQLLIERLLKKQ